MAETKELSYRLLFVNEDPEKQGVLVCLTNQKLESDIITRMGYSPIEVVTQGIKVRGRRYDREVVGYPETQQPVVFSTRSEGHAFADIINNYANDIQAGKMELNDIPSAR